MAIGAPVQLEIIVSFLVIVTLNCLTIFLAFSVTVMCPVIASAGIVNFVLASSRKSFGLLSVFSPTLITI
jgi:hypothetical protein